MIHARDLPDRANVPDMRKLIIILSLAATTTALFAQTGVPQQFALVTFNEYNFTGEVHLAGAKAEAITVPTMKGETKIVTLSAVMARLEALQAEGWIIEDFEVSMYGKVTNGSSTGGGTAYYTWFLSRPKR